MSTESYEQRYFEWLYDQVAVSTSRARAKTFRSLLKQLHAKEFLWFVANDGNRVEDGRDLRYEFLAQHQEVQGDPEWTGSSCTMLELFVVLARLLAFEMDEEPRVWFWHLIEVLDLEQFNDRDYDSHAKEMIDEALDRVIWRTYAPNGVGGLFPLRRPEKDQRKVELWYQLNAYLIEHFC